MSECPASLLLLLLSAALNLQQLKTGIHCQLSDQLFLEVFLANQLQHLTSLHIPAARELGLPTLQLFLDHCPLLASLQDLNYWGGLDPGELAAFRASLVRANLALEAGAALPQAQTQK